MEFWNALWESIKSGWKTLTSKNPMLEFDQQNVERAATETPAKETPAKETPQAPTLQVQDTTNENIESPINGVSAGFDWQKYLEDERNARWEREDAIRAEVQAREDSAIRRQTEDAWKAGINPNLINITGAESGGGITQASGMDYTAYQTEMEKYLKEYELMLEQNFKGDQNEKDRMEEVFRQILSTGLNLAMMYFLKGGK